MNVLAPLLNVTVSKRRASMNVHDNERLACVLAGAAGMFQATRARGLHRWITLALAGALLYRGITGHCDLYERAGFSSR